MPQEEAGYKLLKVKRNQFGKGGVPFIATHDGRTIRYPDPDIKVRSGWGAVHPFLCRANLCSLLADVRPGQGLSCAEQTTLCKATLGSVSCSCKAGLGRSKRRAANNFVVEGSQCAAVCVF